jgi:branched-chain amino acid aminotransferase
VRRQLRGLAAAAGQGAAHGCAQVVYLDAEERRWVDEMGSNNLFFVYGSGDQSRS